MGQLLSNLWWWNHPKSKNETPRDVHHQPNYQTNSLDDNQITSHYINIPADHHIQPILSSSTAKSIGNHVSSLVPSTPHIVVDVNKAYEEEKAKKKQRRKKNKKPIIDHGDQVIPKQVSGKNVAATISPVASVRNIGHYNSSQKLLLVGEGDFSFAACLAVAFGNSAVNITATSLDSEDFLVKNYGKFITNKAELGSRGSTVIHEVNATKMVKHPLLGSFVFDRIIYNFPHTGKFGQSDTEMRSHQKLIRGFLRNAKKMTGEDGEIHITSKSNGFFLEWNIPKMGSDHGLKLIQEVKFKRSMYPGYNPKYGFGGDKDFDCNPSITYKFGLSNE